MDPVGLGSGTPVLDKRRTLDSSPGRLRAFLRSLSGVVRNSRTFHPDGRVFVGTVRSLNPSDPALARASERLEGGVLLRMGMGVMKRGMPAWLADRIPDAPSIAARFYTPSTPG